MSSFWGVLGYPSARVPISVATFVSYVAPPVVGFLVFAVLAITPQTRTIRVALWPVIGWLTLRAAVSVDMSRGEYEKRFLNTDFFLFMVHIAVYTFSWVSAEKPLVRYLRPANSSPSVIMDALDLISNSRGIGWHWSRGLHIPRDTRPTNRKAFALHTFLSGVAHALLCGSLYVGIRTFTEVAGAVPKAYTLYDETLPFFVRHFRATIIATMAAFGVYSVLSMFYHLSTAFSVLFLGYDPAQWPPAFDRPWRATSLIDFWNRRWHQLYRHMFLVIAHPLYLVFGRAGRVVGAFLASAVFHHAIMLTFDSQSEPWRMFVGFGMMAPAVLAERMFYKLTGRKVGGVVGWFWTMTWLVSAGCVIVDGFARAGMYESSSPVDGRLPVRALVQKLVTDFDAWLHTL